MVWFIIIIIIIIIIIYPANIPYYSLAMFTTTLAEISYVPIKTKKV
jgi:hypothetical protein